MKFVDRENETKRLKRVLSQEGPAQLVIIYGRRRLGKSTLIRHVLTDNDIYFMADQTEQSQQLALLAKTIGTKIPDFDKVVYPDWETLIVSLAHRATNRFTLCLDEFPYLVKSTPSLPSILQRHIDSKQLPFNVIICGSSQQMMQGLVLDAASPLYGRGNVIMKLDPIAIRYLQEILHASAVQTIEESAIWGGVPRYWEIREQELRNLRLCSPSSATEPIASRKLLAGCKKTPPTSAAHLPNSSTWVISSAKSLLVKTLATANGATTKSATLSCAPIINMWYPTVLSSVCSEMM